MRRSNCGSKSQPQKTRFILLWLAPPGLVFTNAHDASSLALGDSFSRWRSNFCDKKSLSQKPLILFFFSPPGLVWLRVCHKKRFILLWLAPSPVGDFQGLSVVGWLSLGHHEYLSGNRSSRSILLHNFYSLYPCQQQRGWPAVYITDALCGEHRKDAICFAHHRRCWSSWVSSPPLGFRHQGQFRALYRFHGAEARTNATQAPPGSATRVRPRLGRSGQNKTSRSPPRRHPKGTREALKAELANDTIDADKVSGSRETDRRRKHASDTQSLRASSIEVAAFYKTLEPHATKRRSARARAGSLSSPRVRRDFLRTGSPIAEFEDKALHRNGARSFL